jgi:hypothetical protein
VDWDTRDQMPDDYEALHDARLVMMEVLELVRDLQQAANRLGDAIVAAGLNARDWRSSDARLTLLSDQLPDITLDELITRLAEFSAAHGPDWLHGGAAEIERFKDEVDILYGVTRPLRMITQRLRMLPAYERSEIPLERALGKGGVGTPLDLVAGTLRDLDALSPYLMPLTPEQWSSSLPARTTSTVDHPVGSRGRQSPAKDSSPGEERSFTRLRDFAQAPGTDTLGEAMTPSERSKDLTRRLSSWVRAHTQHLPINKWIAVAAAIVILASGTLLLSMAARSASGDTAGQAPASQLLVSPTQVSLACSGKGATLQLSLRNSGKTPLKWSIKTPKGLVLSATQGTLLPGKTVILQVKSSGAKPEQGLLIFTASNSSARVPYSVRCG